MARFTKLEFDRNEEHRSNVESIAASRVDDTAWQKRAEESRRLGAYEGALQYYSRALESDKTQVACWVGQVQMLVLLEEYPEAELWSRKALELFPAEADLFASRAQALIRQSKTRDAFGAIDQAMQQPGQSAYRWTVRGELLLAGRQPTEKHCFDKALQIDSDWLVPAEISLIYTHYGQPNNALARARLAVERDAASPYAWYVLAACQQRMGMAVPARRSAQHCLELKQDFRPAQDLVMETEQGGSLWQRLRSLWSN